MNAEEVVNYFDRLTSDDNFYAAGLLEDLKNIGSIKSYELKSYDLIGHRSWGYDSELVYKIDDKWFIMFCVYEIVIDDVSSILEQVFEVYPEQVNTIKYVRK